MFFAKSQIFFVPMMPFLKIRDVSGQARFLVSANSLNELKAKGIKAMYFPLLFQVISRSCSRFTPAAPTIVHSVLH